MNADNRKIFANLDADDVLIELDLTQPPFDPYEIAQAMGLKVLENFNILKLNTEGEAYINKDGDPEVWINPKINENRKRFTLAHEIGHITKDILPRIKTLNKAYVDKKDTNNITFRRSGTSNPVEVRANRFASELLMPKFAMERS